MKNTTPCKVATRDFVITLAAPMLYNRQQKLTVARLEAMARRSHDRSRNKRPARSNIKVSLRSGD